MAKSVSKIVKGVGLSSCILGFSLLASPSVVEAKVGVVLPVDDGTVYNGSDDNGTVTELHPSHYTGGIYYVTADNVHIGEQAFISFKSTLSVSDLKIPEGYELVNPIESLVLSEHDKNFFKLLVREKRDVAEIPPAPATEEGDISIEPINDSGNLAAIDEPSIDEPSTSDVGVGTNTPSTSDNSTNTEEPSTSEVGVGTEEPTTSEVGVGTDTPLTSEVGTSTDEPSTSDVGTSTEEPSTSDSSTNTDEPSTSEVGTSTDEPETTDSSTNTEEPSTSDVGVGTAVETKDEETQVDFITANPPVKNDSYENKPDIQPLEQNPDTKAATDNPPTDAFHKGVQRTSTQGASTPVTSTQGTSTPVTSTQTQDYSTSAVKGLPETGYQGKKLTFIGLGLSLVGSVLAFLGIRFRKAKG